MSDTPQAGWWKAKDGRWYPPETHPEHAGAVSAGPPGAGWWQADDGNWYPPGTPPAFRPTGPVGDGAELQGVQPAAQEQHTGTVPDVVQRPDGLFGGVAPRHMTPVGEPVEAMPLAPSVELAPSIELAPGIDLSLGTEAASGTDAPAPGGRPGARGSRRRVAVIAVVLGVMTVVAAAAVAGVLILGGGDDPTPRGTPSTTEAPDATTPSTTTSTTTTTTTTSVVAPLAGLSGTGSAVVAMPSTISEQYLALVTHDGGGAFGLSLLDAAGAAVQEPMGSPAAGRYLGVLPVNFVAGQSFASVRVDADGPWAVTFASVESAPTASTTPGVVHRGTGDQVVHFVADADTPVSLACADCGSPISAVAFGGDGAPGALLGAVGGVTTVPAGTRLLQITARAGVGGSVPTWTLAPQ